MRKERGTGSVVKIGKSYYARRRTHGTDVYGPARDTLDLAEADRLLWKKSPTPPKKRSECPLMGDWALAMMEGEYGKSLASETFDTNELYRHRWINRSR